jgi:hypothetical protein
MAHLTDVEKNLAYLTAPSGVDRNPLKKHCSREKIIRIFDVAHRYGFSQSETSA